MARLALVVLISAAVTLGAASGAAARTGSNRHWPPMDTFTQAMMSIAMTDAVPDGGHLLGSRRDCRTAGRGWSCRVTVKLPDGLGRHALRVLVSPDGGAVLKTG